MKTARRVAAAMCLIVAASSTAGCGVADRAKQAKKSADTAVYAVRAGTALARYASAVAPVTPDASALDPTAPHNQPNPPPNTVDPTESLPTVIELRTAADGVRDARRAFADVDAPDRAQAQHDAVSEAMQQVAVQLDGAAATSAALDAAGGACVVAAPCTPKQQAAMRRASTSMQRVTGANARVGVDLEALVNAVGGGFEGFEDVDLAPSADPTAPA